MEREKLFLMVTLRSMEIGTLPHHRLDQLVSLKPGKVKGLSSEGHFPASLL